MKHRLSTSIEPGSWRFWLISIIAFLGLSCAITSTMIGYDYIYDSLEPCKWLDVYLERSSCIQVLTYSYYEGYVLDIAFSPDKQEIAVGGRGDYAKIWAISGELRHKLNDYTIGSPSAIAFAPNGKIVALGENFYEDNTVSLINLETGTLFFRREGLNGYIHDLIFTPDGTILATATGQDGNHLISLWQVSDGQLLRSFVPDHGGYIRKLVFSPDGEKLLEAYYGIDIGVGVYIWQVRDGALIDKIAFQAQDNLEIALSPGGTMLASGNCIQKGEINCVKAEIKIWQVDNRQLLNTLSISTDYVNTMAFSPDGSLLAAVGQDTDVHLWRIEDRTLLATLKKPEGGAGALAFSPDGKILAVGGTDIILWRIK